MVVLGRDSPLHNTTSHKLIMNFKIPVEVVPGKSLTDKQYLADSFLHSTSCHIPIYVSKFKILSQVVPEKSLTEKSYT